MILLKVSINLPHTHFFTYWPSLTASRISSFLLAVALRVVTTHVVSVIVGYSVPSSPLSLGADVNSDATSGPPWICIRHIQQHALSIWTEQKTSFDSPPHYLSKNVRDNPVTASRATPFLKTCFVSTVQTELPSYTPISGSGSNFFDQQTVACNWESPCERLPSNTIAKESKH